MKALDNLNIGSRVCGDVIERSVRFSDIKNKSISTGEDFAQYNFHGMFRPEMISLAALRFPFPAIFVQEDMQGNYHALGEYANDLMTSIVKYLNDCSDDERHIIRRVEDTYINITVIRCTSSNEQVNELQALLKTLNISR